MPEKIEQKQNFEQIIAQEVNNLGLDSSELEGIEASGRVSEVVGENASENIPTSSGGAKKDDDDSAKSLISQAVSSLLFRPVPVKDQVLPTPQKQKKEVKKAIAKRTRELVDEATRLQRASNFSPDKLEKLVAEIRQMRSLLQQMVSITVDRLEALYKQFVWKQ